MNGFVKLHRSPETLELISRDPLAFALLTQITMRARWRSTFDIRGLELGEALVGDYKRLGLTRQEYRTRLERLVKCGLITIRATRRGTIAKLASQIVFDIGLTSAESPKNQPAQQPSDCTGRNDFMQPTGQSPANQQPTTNAPVTNKEKQNHNSTDAADLFHPLWPRFAKFCKSRGGSPTLKGFRTWLRSQPQVESKKICTNKNRPAYEDLLRGSQELADRENGLTPKTVVGIDTIEAFKAANEAAGLHRKFQPPL